MVMLLTLPVFREASLDDTAATPDSRTQTHTHTQSATLCNGRVTPVVAICCGPALRITSHISSHSGAIHLEVSQEPQLSVRVFSRCYIYIYIYIQGVTGGTDQTSGECSLGHTIPI